MRKIAIRHRGYKHGHSKLLLVKAVKYITGLGLKEAKHMVDDWCEDLLFTDPKKILSLESTLPTEELKKILDGLEESKQYESNLYDYIQRDVAISKTLAKFEFTLDGLDGIYYVAEGSYTVNKDSGVVEVLIDEATKSINNGFDTEEITNAKLSLHISNINILENLES